LDIIFAELDRVVRAMFTKVIFVVSLLATAFFAGWHGFFLLADTANGRPWSAWYFVLVVGALLLFLASIMALWKPYMSSLIALIGSFLLAAFYIPATFNAVKEYLSPTPDIYSFSELALALAAPICVLVTLTMSTVFVITSIRYGRFRKKDLQEVPRIASLAH
jgi:hypothetical protein